MAHTGIPTSFYSRHKAAVRADARLFEREHPAMRVVRLRPGLIFKREAATGIRRLFAGPFLPGAAAAPGAHPGRPDHPRLRFQAVHSLDVGEAYRLAVARRDARGAYNVAAEPVLDPPSWAGCSAPDGPGAGDGAARWPPAHLAAAAAAHPPGWVDLGLGVPLMDTARARDRAGLGAAAPPPPTRCPS